MLLDELRKIPAEAQYPWPVIRLPGMYGKFQLKFG